MSVLVSICLRLGVTIYSIGGEFQQGNSNFMYWLFPMRLHAPVKSAIKKKKKNVVLVSLAFSYDTA